MRATRSATAWGPRRTSGTSARISVRVGVRASATTCMRRCREGWTRTPNPMSLSSHAMMSRNGHSATWKTMTTEDQASPTGRLCRTSTAAMSPPVIGPPVMDTAARHPSRATSAAGRNGGAGAAGSLAPQRLRPVRRARQRGRDGGRLLRPRRQRQRQRLHPPRRPRHLLGIPAPPAALCLPELVRPHPPLPQTGFRIAGNL